MYPVADMTSHMRVRRADNLAHGWKNTRKMWHRLLMKNSPEQIGKRPPQSSTNLQSQTTWPKKTTSQNGMRLKGGLVLSKCKILFYHQNWENSTVKKCKVSPLKCFLFELNWTFGSEVTVFLSEEAWKFGSFCYTFMCKTLNLLFLINSLKIFLVKITVTFD